MSPVAQSRHPFDYSGLDEQIEKFRQLAAEYRRDNVAYYGEYLSSILFGDSSPDPSPPSPDTTTPAPSASPKTGHA